MNRNRNRIAKESRLPHEIIIKGIKLSEMIEEHELWLKSNYLKGVQLNLLNVDLEDLSLLRFELRESIFKNVNLNGSHIEDVNFFRSEFIETSFVGSELFDTKFFQTNINNVNFSKLIAYNIDLQTSNIKNTKFQEANLYKLDFAESGLENVYFNNSDLANSFFQYARLCNIEFSHTRFYNINFTESIIKNTDFTAAIFYNVTRFDWDLDEVKCDYIFLDINGTERFPPERNFKPGEFEILFKEVPTIELVFDDGFDVSDYMTLPVLDNYMKSNGKDYGIEFYSINRLGLIVKAIFKVSPSSDKDEAFNELTKAHAELKAKYELLSELYTKERNRPTFAFYDRIENLPIGELVSIDQSTNIQITIKEAVFEIEKAIENADEEVFEKEGIKKKGILTSLKKAANLIGEGSMKKAGEIIMDSGIEGLKKVIPEVARQLPFILSNLGM